MTDTIFQFAKPADAADYVQHQRAAIINTFKTDEDKKLATAGLDYMLAHPETLADLQTTTSTDAKGNATVKLNLKPQIKGTLHVGADKTTTIQSGLEKLDETGSFTVTEDPDPKNRSTTSKAVTWGLPLVAGLLGLMLGGGDLLGVLIGVVLSLVTMFLMPAIANSDTGHSMNLHPGYTPATQVTPPQADGPVLQLLKPLTTQSVDITHGKLLPDGTLADTRTEKLEYIGTERTFGNTRSVTGNRGAIDATLTLAVNIKQTGGLVGKTVVEKGETFFDAQGLTFIPGDSAPSSALRFSAPIRFVKNEKGEIDLKAPRNKESYDKLNEESKALVQNPGLKEYAQNIGKKYTASLSAPLAPSVRTAYRFSNEAPDAVKNGEVNILAEMNGKRIVGIADKEGFITFGLETGTEKKDNASVLVLQEGSKIKDPAIQIKDGKIVLDDAGKKALTEALDKQYKDRDKTKDFGAAPSSANPAKFTPADSAKALLTSLGGLFGSKPKQNMPQDPSPADMQETPKADHITDLKPSDPKFKTALTTALTEYLDPKNSWIDKNDSTKIATDKNDIQRQVSTGLLGPSMSYPIAVSANEAGKGKSPEELIAIYLKNNKEERDKKIHDLIEKVSQQPDYNKALSLLSEELGEQIPLGPKERQQAKEQLKKDLLDRTQKVLDGVSTPAVTPKPVPSLSPSSSDPAPPPTPAPDKPPASTSRAERLKDKDGVYNPKFMKPENLAKEAKRFGNQTHVIICFEDNKIREASEFVEKLGLEVYTFNTKSGYLVCKIPADKPINADLLKQLYENKEVIQSVEPRTGVMRPNATTDHTKNPASDIPEALKNAKW